MSECWVYKVFHSAFASLSQKEVSLYAGISDCPSDRMSQHNSDKWWWHLVDRIEWQKLDCRKLAKRIESSIISEERPVFNKQESTLTAGQRLLSCLRLVEDSFRHCPICFTACRYSPVDWDAKGLCCVDVGEDEEAYCFEVWMSCSHNHSPLEWCQFVPVRILLECRTKMPENVLGELWNEAEANGEVGDDIPHLRPMTLADMFATPFERRTEPVAAIGVRS
jgi:hypothetical protein